MLKEIPSSSLISVVISSFLCCGVILLELNFLFILLFIICKFVSFSSISKEFLIFGKKLSCVREILVRLLFILLLLFVEFCELFPVDLASEFSFEFCRGNNFSFTSGYK